jgi:hypothetical protein
MICDITIYRILLVSAFIFLYFCSRKKEIFFNIVYRIPESSATKDRENWQIPNQEYSL